MCHRHLPVIFLTGKHGVAERLDRHSNGSLFLKPVQEDALISRVRELAPLEC